MITLTFTNQKGGTGKTTSAVSVAAGLARHGYKVLLVDADPQGHASISSGIIPDEKDRTIYEVLTGRARISAAIRKTANGYDLIPTDIRESGADIELANEKHRDFILADALDTIKEKYDYAIIDSPPNLSVITLMALTAADGVVITVKADYLALNGVAQLRDTIEIVKKRMNPQLEITGVLLTFYDNRKTLDKQIAEFLEEGFPGKVFDTRISQAVALAEAPAVGVNIFDYKPGSKPALQYESVVNEILKRKG